MSMLISTNTFPKGQNLDKVVPNKTRQTATSFTSKSCLFVFLDRTCDLHRNIPKSNNFQILRSARNLPKSGKCLDFLLFWL